MLIFILLILLVWIVIKKSLKQKRIERAARWRHIKGGGWEKDPFIPASIANEAYPSKEKGLIISGYSVKRLIQEHGFGPVTATWVLAALDLSPAQVCRWLANDKKTNAGRSVVTHTFDYIDGIGWSCAGISLEQASQKFHQYLYARENDLRPHLADWGLRYSPDPTLPGGFPYPGRAKWPTGWPPL